MPNSKNLVQTFIDQMKMGIMQMGGCDMSSWALVGCMSHFLNYILFLFKVHQKFGIQLWLKVKGTWIWSASKLEKNAWLLLLPPMKWQNQSRNQKSIKWRRTKSKCNFLHPLFDLHWRNTLLYLFISQWFILLRYLMVQDLKALKV